MSRKYGLKLIHPKVSLLFVIISTSLFAFISSIDYAIGVFIVSSLVLILGRRLVFKKIFFYVLLINTIYMVLGNWLFSPTNPDSVNFLFFELNNVGLHNGFIGALKRNAMIVLSFAWLSSIDSLYDVYIAIDVIKKFNKTIIIFLKWIQNLKHDFTSLYYSMHLRGFKLKSKNPRKKLFQLNIILKAVLNRFFSDIGKMTFNGESHFNYDYEENNNIGTVEITDLSVAYDIDISPIIENINLTIPEGEVIFVTGNNNSGKTTLLKVISGYIPKIEGYIINGDVIVSKKSLNSDISLKEINKFLRYIVENPADSIIGLNVKQELLSQTNDNSLVLSYSKLLNIVHLWKRDVNTLSGGEQARVVLASLLCSDAKILILESPLGQLDPSGRIAFISALKELANSKSTTIIISDQYAEYYNGIIDRLIMLESGQIRHDILVNNSQVNKILDDLNLGYPFLKPFNKSKNSSEIVASMKNISLLFGDKKVLTNINCDFYHNQCISIMGDNGSGKSTSMLTLAKVLNASTGHVDVFGNNIGMIFQDCSKQILENIVLEEIILNLKNDNIKKNKQMQFANEMLSWSQLKANESTIDISASQVRLLEISSNIFNKDIIIFDEPTNSLDSHNIKKLHSFIQKLLDNNKTVIIITHDKQLASLCNRFLLMHDSKIILDTINFEEILLKRKQISNA